MNLPPAIGQPRNDRGAGAAADLEMQSPARPQFDPRASGLYQPPATTHPVPVPRKEVEGTIGSPDEMSDADDDLSRSASMRPHKQVGDTTASPETIPDADDDLAHPVSLSFAKKVILCLKLVAGLVSIGLAAANYISLNSYSLDYRNIVDSWTAGTMACVLSCTRAAVCV